MKNTKRSLRYLLVVAVLVQPLAAHAKMPADLGQIQMFLGLMQEYFRVIDSTHEISANPEKAAIFQMQKIQEIYEERGEKAKAVDVFRDVLKNTNNPAIRNAAYMLIGDALKETGRADQAIKLLKDGLNENIEIAK